MPAIAMRTLFVGKPGPEDIAALTRMGRKGWGSYSADNLREARLLIEEGGLDLVLALRGLPDGSAYELIPQVRGRESTLFVGLPHDRLWIPVVQRGERVFGDQAIHADNVESVWEQVLLAASEKGKKDGTPKSTWAVAPPSQDLGYAPIQISLGPTCGTDSPPPQPKQRRIAAIARLQLRCASFGLLRAGKSRDEVERFDKTAQPAAGDRRVARARSISGMRSRGRRD